MIAGGRDVALLPRNLFRTAKTLAGMPVAYARSAVGALRHREAFGDLQGFCLFIGYPRSGHSIFGALLDAHPDVVIGDELNVLSHVRFGFSRRQIFELLVRSAASRGRAGGGYRYEVPGQWQTRSRTVRIIGDKKGMGSTLWLGRSPGILDRLRRRVGVPLRVIHVARNPYDTIATMWKRRRDGASTLSDAADLYFRLCATVGAVRPTLAERELFEVRHEELLADPRATLRRLCGFLDVEDEPSFIEAAAAIVYESPHRSRLDVDWSDEVKERVRDGIAATPHLNGYGYDD